MKELSNSAATGTTRSRALLMNVLKQQMLDVVTLRKMVAEAERLAAIQVPSLVRLAPTVRKAASATRTQNRSKT